MEIEETIFSEEEDTFEKETMWELFIDDCIIDLIDFISKFRESIPYISKIATSDIVLNIIDYTLKGKTKNRIVNYSIDENLLTFFTDNVNEILKNNQRLYNVKPINTFSLNYMVYMLV